jgi:hypothetical protein
VCSSDLWSRDLSVEVGGHGVVSHRTRGREAHTLTGLSTEIAHLRIALDTLATTVRRHEEQLRRLRRHDKRTDS